MTGLRVIASPTAPALARYLACNNAANPRALRKVCADAAVAEPDRATKELMLGNPPPNKLNTSHRAPRAASVRLTTLHRRAEGCWEGRSRANAGLAQRVAVWPGDSLIPRALCAPGPGCTAATSSPTSPLATFAHRPLFPSPAPCQSMPLTLHKPPRPPPTTTARHPSSSGMSIEQYQSWIMEKFNWG